MNEKNRSRKMWCVLLAALLVLPGGALAQESGAAQAQTQAQGQAKTFSQEQLDQLLAPVALYPDDLLTQILMASTYPLEVVKANNWVKQNKDLKGDALAKALEKQEWDPSVRSLVNFPQVLQMMSDKLDWTQKLGDAFLAQQKDVLATVQGLRKKAYDSGNLKSGKEQTVKVEQDPQVIIIQQASPEVIYVPTYNPTVVYGVWAYPAYPPYPAYPYGYGTGAFLAGAAVGVAWGYAWGNCNWHGGDVNVNVNRNTNINNNIDRGKHAQQQTGRGGQGGSGKWQHDPGHRQGVSYRDSATAKQHGQGTGRQTPSNSQARGYGDRSGGGAQAGTMDRGGQAGAAKAGSSDRGGGGSAFSGAGGGSSDRSASQRGQSSRGASASASSGARGGGGGGGGSRGGGGGGGRGGGGRR
jgi:hypothetical protein